MDDAGAALVRRCTDLVRGRRVVLVGGVLAGSTQRVRQLRAFGAAGVLVLADGVGTGELPSPEEAETVVVEPSRRPQRVSEEAAAWVAFAADPPPAARAALARFDPDRRAVALLGSFATVTDFVGRDVLGGRTEAAQALEDKTACDRLWDDAGVARAPSVVTRCRWADLVAASARVDRGAGVVWSGDASSGVNGAGDSVRWVRDADDARAALADLSRTSERVRVMPFLDGVPCSIHGFVVDDDDGHGDGADGADAVAAFRPVELVTLRGTDGGGAARFVGAGISSCWAPPAPDRERMRSVARRVGAHLSGAIGYRGGFSVDGVLTAAGWLPTELNPRYSGGLNIIARGVPELPLELLQGAVVRGVDVGATARLVEDVLLPAADAHPYGSAHSVVKDRVVTATERVDVTGGPGRLEVAGPADPVVGTMEIGPAQVGALVRFLPAHHRAGQRLAPYAVSMLALSDRLWGTTFGALTAAPDLR